MSFAKPSMDPPPLARAYAVVPTMEEEQHIVQHITPTSVVRFDDEGCEDHVNVDAAYRLYGNNNGSSKMTNLSAAYRTVNPTLYGHLPEAASLSWQDDYFDNDDNVEEDIVAVFDLDYDEMERYWEKVSWTSLGASLLIFPHLAWIAVLGLAPCYLRQNVRWSIRAQHVAITRDGIRFVRERRPTCWGSACTDAGRTTKTIPFDHVTDCSIEEPAGNTCLWIPNTLHTVQIDTASSEKSQHELTIVGLKDPVAFKRLVWAMKRHYHPGRPDPMPATTGAAGSSGAASSPIQAPRAAASASTNAAMERALTSLAQSSSSSTNGGGDPDVVAALLREIRDELRQNNEAIRGLSSSSSRDRDGKQP